MNRPRLLSLAAAALVAALVIGALRAPRGSAAAEPAGKGSRAAAIARTAEKGPAPGPRLEVDAKMEDGQSSPSPDLPSSLSGTEVDGGLDVGEDGHLVLGPRVIALFDYFFSAEGEESAEAVRARIAAHARASLGEPALSEALALLDRYVAYRAAGRTMSIQNGAPAADRLEAVRRLRREHFGDDATALFGDDERAAEAAVARSRVVSDPEIGPEDRESALAEIDSRLPAASRAAREEATAVLTLRADEEVLREGGADAEAIHRYRESRFGAEAADRLDDLDRRRAAFKARIEAFQAEVAKTCPSEADPAACEARILERDFDARERIRVRTLVSMPTN